MSPGEYALLAALGDQRMAVPWEYRDRNEYKLHFLPDDIRAGIREAPIVDIELDGLCAIQHTVSVARVVQYLFEPALAAGRTHASGTPDDVPAVLVFGGNRYLHNGHHRATAAWLRGERATPGRLVDLDAAAKKSKTSTKVQTLVFDKKKFTRKKAVAWAKTHDFKSSDVDETETSYRLRQRDPVRFVAGSFRTIKLAVGIKAVIGRLK